MNPPPTYRNPRSYDFCPGCSHGRILDALDRALTRVLQDDDLRRRLGHNAARYADRTLLSWDERIDREIARIEAILHPAGRAQGGTGTPSRCR